MPRFASSLRTAWAAAATLDPSTAGLGMSGSSDLSSVFAQVGGSAPATRATAARIAALQCLGAAGAWRRRQCCCVASRRCCLNIPARKVHRASAANTRPALDAAQKPRAPCNSPGTLPVRLKAST